MKEKVLELIRRYGEACKTEGVAATHYAQSKKQSEQLFESLASLFVEDKPEETAKPPDMKVIEPKKTPEAVARKG